MSMFSNPGGGIGNSLAQSTASEAGSAARGPQSRAHDAERRVEQLVLICNAMWDLVREKTGLTEQDLIERVAILDCAGWQGRRKACTGSIQMRQMQSHGSSPIRSACTVETQSCLIPFLKRSEQQPRTTCTRRFATPNPPPHPRRLPPPQTGQAPAAVCHIVHVSMPNAINPISPGTGISKYLYLLPHAQKRQVIDPLCHAQ